MTQELGEVRIARAGLYDPVVRRLQDRLFEDTREIRSTVDRRFNHARYDAQHTVAGLIEQLRNEVDIEQLRRALLSAVENTVAPVHATVWLHREVTR